MVAVVVGDEHPADIFGIDDAEQIVEVLVSVDGGSGVDHDGFGAGDHHRVEMNNEGRFAFAEGGLDDPSVIGDAQGFVTGRGWLCLVHGCRVLLVQDGLVLAT